MMVLSALLVVALVVGCVFATLFIIGILALSGIGIAVITALLVLMI